MHVLQIKKWFAEASKYGMVKVFYIIRHCILDINQIAKV